MLCALCRAELDGCWPQPQAVGTTFPKPSPTGQRAGYIIMNETAESRQLGMQHPLRFSTQTQAAPHGAPSDAEGEYPAAEQLADEQAAPTGAHDRRLAVEADVLDGDEWHSEGGARVERGRPGGTKAGLGPGRSGRRGDGGGGVAPAAVRQPSVAGVHFAMAMDPQVMVTLHGAGAVARGGAGDGRVGNGRGGGGLGDGGGRRQREREGWRGWMGWGARGHRSPQEPAGGMGGALVVTRGTVLPSHAAFGPARRQATLRLDDQPGMDGPPLPPAARSPIRPGATRSRPRTRRPGPVSSRVGT